MTGGRRGTTERVVADAAVVTAVLVTSVGLFELVTGSSRGWSVLAIGWGVLVPLAAGAALLVTSVLRTGFDAAVALFGGPHPGFDPDPGSDPVVTVADGGADEPANPHCSSVEEPKPDRSDRSDRSIRSDRSERS